MEIDNNKNRIIRIQGVYYRKIGGKYLVAVKEVSALSYCVSVILQICQRTRGNIIKVKASKASNRQ